MENAAAGMGALGFWLFIAAIVLGGIWDAARKRETQQETLRRVIESGSSVDQATVERILGSSGDPQSNARDLKVAATIVLYIAPGLAILGLCIWFINQQALLPIIGTAILMAFIGLGLRAAARIAEGTDQQDASD